jgi:hypothetical protein
MRWSGYPDHKEKRMHLKDRIEDRAIAGLPIDPHAVAAVSRDRRVITLRHAWPENVDGRVWDGVRRAYQRLAREIANSTGRGVEVYAKQGYMLDAISPELE